VKKQPGMDLIGWQADDFTFPFHLSAYTFLRVPVHTSK